MLSCLPSHSDHLPRRWFPAPAVGPLCLRLLLVVTTGIKVTLGPKKVPPSYQPLCEAVSPAPAPRPLQEHLQSRNFFSTPLQLQPQQTQWVQSAPRQLANLLTEVAVVVRELLPNIPLAPFLPQRYSNCILPSLLQLNLPQLSLLVTLPASFLLAVGLATPLATVDSPSIDLGLSKRRLSDLKL